MAWRGRDVPPLIRFVPCYPDHPYAAWRGVGVTCRTLHYATLRYNLLSLTLFDVPGPAIPLRGNPPWYLGRFALYPVASAGGIAGGAGRAFTMRPRPVHTHAPLHIYQQVQDGSYRVTLGRRCFSTLLQTLHSSPCVRQTG